MDALRKQLDALMGANRNSDLKEVNHKYYYRDVCRLFLVGLCPHDLFQLTVHGGRAGGSCVAELQACVQGLQQEIRLWGALGGHMRIHGSTSVMNQFSGLHEEEDDEHIMKRRQSRSRDEEEEEAEVEAEAEDSSGRNHLQITEPVKCERGRRRRGGSGCVLV